MIAATSRRPTVGSRRPWSLGFCLFTAACAGPANGELAGNLSATESCSACNGDCRLETLRYDSARHVEDPIDYPDPPPAGGPHAPCWAAWGSHAAEVDDERWVHNLEHGGVVVLHDCRDCETDVADADSWVATLGGRGLSTPYAALAGEWALIAWGKRMLLGCWDRGVASGFYDDFGDSAPESTTAAPPAACN